MTGNDYRAYVENNYNSLYHYGVKGQKWGVRRYQNSDGSLTAEGAARYRSSSSRMPMVPKVVKSNIKRHKFAAKLATAPARAVGRSIGRKAAMARDVGKLMWRDKKKLAKEKLDDIVDSKTFRTIRPIEARIARKLLGKSTSKSPKATLGRAITGTVNHNVGKRARKVWQKTTHLPSYLMPGELVRSNVSRALKRDADIIRGYKKEVKASRKAAKKKRKK